MGSRSPIQEKENQKSLTRSRIEKIQVCTRNKMYDLSFENIAE